MKKVKTLKLNYEFKNVFNRGKYFRAHQVIGYVLTNKFGYNRLGLAISTKLCKAVGRNRIKRIIRAAYLDLIREYNLKQGYDIVFIWNKNVNIDNISKKLNIKINVVPCPEDANNRQAEISTKLYSGSTDIDLISVNDEMVSEFKSKGYLEPLDDIMTEDVLQLYPKDYVESVSMYKNSIFSVPYMMDIMMFWVNEKYVRQSKLQDIKNIEDFLLFLDYDYGTAVYAYGGAWEETYIYNDLSQFINMFGGDYYNWNNSDTRAAVIFLHDMLKNGYTSKGQMIDRYEQMEQKFIDGKYGSVFMYSGAMNVFYNSGKYGKDEIHLSKLPKIKSLTTNIATWQYVLNKASKNKSAAKRFLEYVSSKEGCIEYSNAMNQIPARVDVILNENINVPDIDTIREYVSLKNLRIGLGS